MPPRDITTSFLQSCHEIPPGRLVKAPNLHMLDAMNALTVLDPRMDTGMRRAPSSARRPIEAEMSAEEVLAVMDRLVQNEVAWHAGWPLVPTVFTSRHLLSHPHADEPTGTPSQRILAPYLRAYESSLAYTWHELCRGALYEGEDWAGDLAGREEWEVPEWEEGALRDAREAVEALVIDPELKHQLHLRLAIRQAFLLQLATTLSGGTAPADTASLIPQLTFPADGPARAAPFFDAAAPRRFRQTMPVPRVPLPSAPDAYASLGATMDGLRWVCEVRDWTRRPSLDARERQAWVFALGSGAGAEWSPVVRSCMTWSIVDGFVYPLQQADLLRQWTREYASLAGRDFELDRTLFFSSGESIERVGEVRRFFDTLCENIRMDMHDRCQNRARQHRLYTLSAQRWQDLSLLLPDVLEAEEHAQIVRGISSRRGDALLDALLASLDLGLVDGTEWASVYWVLWRAAEDRQSHVGGRPSWRTSWARAWAHVGRGLHFAFSARSASKARTNPHEKAVFDHRFSPFQPKAMPNGSTFVFRTHSYDDYADSRSTIRGMTAESLRELTESSFHSAAQAFADVHTQLETEDTGPGDQQRKANEKHKAICRYLEETVQAYLDDDTDQDPEGFDSQCSKWLPPVRDVRRALHDLQ